ncbi:DUF262 domain-containing protein [Polyangium aurulentum]|uniref:DUF262 domain-containing protein n=1 Tax=Polyangium aurulentum TaxID=2567896 RepID=UPI00146E193C|nr:DUF262 domain-containing protein [Polyangium aurulentum]UQA55362.1 DUF262 domain-containing protein [Polyangium aurulentum]
MQRTSRQQASPAVQPSLDTRLQTTSYRVQDLLDLLQEGRLRMAPFERAWRWAPEDVVALFDSLYRGYPVGALVFWKRRGEDALLVVDGQQRIMALAGALLARQEGDPRPPFDLHFDLERDTFTLTRTTLLSPSPKTEVPVRLLGDRWQLTRWFRAHPGDVMERVDELFWRIRSYQIPAYVVETEDEDAVRQVLRRVSTAGKPLGEADLFDALHGARGEALPGDLREVAERLLDTGFGEFSTEMILRSLRSILHQEGATEGDMHLPEGTTAAEALAHVERSLRRTIAFFREDVRIPFLQLVPYKPAILVLAAFFARYPAPSPRSRQLLSRWVWRSAVIGGLGGDAMPARSTLLALQDLRETAAVSALLGALPERPRTARRLDRFDARSARSKLDTLALFALGPMAFSTGQRVTMSTLFGASATHKGLPPLLHAPSGSNAELERRMSTIANRIAHPPIPARALRELHASEVPTDILESHGISRTAWKALREGDALGFLEARGERLAAHIEAFIEARAEWDQSDRPALTSLVIPDDE